MAARMDGAPKDEARRRTLVDVKSTSGEITRCTAEKWDGSQVQSVKWQAGHKMERVKRFPIVPPLLPGASSRCASQGELRLPPLRLGHQWSPPRSVRRRPTRAAALRLGDVQGGMEHKDFWLRWRTSRAGWVCRMGPRHALCTQCSLSLLVFVLAK